jgi:hypothetical protein
MRYLVLCVSFILGVVLGTYVSRPALVRAQAETSVHVTRLKTSRKEPQSVPGEVIGFSCTAPAIGNEDCFVLSR